MIKEIQEEVQVKVTEQVVTMLQTFIGDVGVLLRYLLKDNKTGELKNERSMETAKALQVLHQFDLENFESESDYDSDIDSDSEDSVSSENGNMKGTGRGRGMNTVYPNSCKCGKTLQQYQKGGYLNHI